jgi:hypothetical protein
MLKEKLVELEISFTAVNNRLTVDVDILEMVQDLIHESLQ